MNFRLVMEQAVVEVLLGLRSGQRTALFRFFRQLCEHPDIKGEFTEFDANLRRMEVKLVQRFQVTFWPDYAVSEIRIVSIVLTKERL